MRETHFLTFDDSELFADALTNRMAFCVASAPSMVRLPGPESDARAFYLLEEPPFSFQELIDRFVHQLDCNPEAYVNMMIYIERVGRMNEDLRVNGQNVGRLITASMYVAARYFSLDVFNLSVFEEVCGLQRRKLAELERVILENLWPSTRVTEAEFGTAIVELHNASRYTEFTASRGTEGQDRELEAQDDATTISRGI